MSDPPHRSAKTMGNPQLADTRDDLTQAQLEYLRKVAASRALTAHEQYVLPDDVHDILIDKGYIRWERGVVLVTAAGILALARNLVEKRP